MAQKSTTVRIGNFEFIEEKDHIKVRDINGYISHRISTDIPKGTLLKMALENGAEIWLQNYVVCMFNVLSCVPDDVFLTEINRSATECVMRHPNLYGIKEDISEEEDAEVLEEQKKLHDAIEGLKD